MYTSECDHDLTEREVSCYADGLCPICLVAENKSLQRLVDTFMNRPAALECPKCKTIIKAI